MTVLEVTILMLDKPIPGYENDQFFFSLLATTSLVLVMFIGAMAGSTAGGIKVSRIVIAAKGAYINVRKIISPRYVPKARVFACKKRLRFHS